MSLIKKIGLTLPLLVFIVIGVVLWRGLSLHPEKVPSPLINKPAPKFQLPLLLYPDKVTSNKDFVGRITLLNVWASWCYACAQEHDLLLELAKNEYIALYGLNYKDDSVAAKKWLNDYGNPYQIIAVDKAGHVAIDFGVYGSPETFVIDKKGVVRYKHIGPLTPDSWKQNFIPLIEQLRKENP